MRSLLLPSIALAGLVSACAQQPASPPMTPAPSATTRSTDTGSMAYPTPVPAGQLNTSTGRAGPDTGSMAYPAPNRPGQITTVDPSNTPADTGSMQEPAPRRTGRTPARRVY